MLSADTLQLIDGASAVPVNATAIEEMSIALYHIIRSHPNAGHLLNAIGFCLFTTPSTFRSPIGGYDESEALSLPRGLK